MARVVLAGGTDVAEVALFDVDALPARLPDLEGLAALEPAVICFPTGADGGYLLHAYVDEDIPAEVMRFCDREDPITGPLHISRGHIGFGGIESLFAGFEPNRNIRADGTIAPGRYEVTAYRTEYPDEMVEEAVRAQLGKGDAGISRLPGYLIPAGILGAIVTGVAASWAYGLAVLIVAFAAVALVFRNQAFRRVAERRAAIEMAYPSIVVEMRAS